jgi:hypothetical protein
MGWRFRVLEFCFFLLGFLFVCLFVCQMCLQQESILFALLKISQARLELGGQAGAWLASGGSVEVTAHLFFQCIMAWRSLPQARG